MANVPIVTLIAPDAGATIELSRVAGFDSIEVVFKSDTDYKRYVIMANGGGGHNIGAEVGAGGAGIANTTASYIVNASVFEDMQIDKLWRLDVYVLSVDGIWSDGSSDEPRRYKLISNGGAWFDTGLYPESNWWVLADIAVATANSGIALQNFAGSGANRAPADMFSVHAATTGANNYLSIAYYTITLAYAEGMPQLQAYERNVTENRGGERYINGVAYGNTGTTPAFVSRYPLALFARRASDLEPLTTSYVLIGGELYSIIVRNKTQSIVGEYIPVPAGDTQYSSTPAPVNCLWNAAAQAYLLPAAGTFGAVELTSETMDMMAALASLGIHYGQDIGHADTKTDIAKMREVLTEMGLNI